MREVLLAGTAQKYCVQEEWQEEQATVGAASAPYAATPDRPSAPTDQLLGSATDGNIQEKDVAHAAIHWLLQ